MADPVPTPHPAPPRPARGWRWLLAGSLTLNLLVAGLALGDFLHNDGHMRRPEVADVGLGLMTGALDPEDRRELMRGLAGRADGIKALRAASQQDLSALAQTLRQDPFVEAEARAVIARMHARMGEATALAQEVLMTRVTAMPAAKRRAFADRLERMATEPRKRP